MTNRSRWDWLSWAMVLMACMAARAAGPMWVVYNDESAALKLGAARLESVLKGLGISMRHVPLSLGSDRTNVIVLSSADAAAQIGEIKLDSAMGPEAFRIAKVPGTDRVIVAAQSDIGAMYGMMDLADQLLVAGDLAGVKEKTATPRFPFRAIKFNLPWSAYRPGLATEQHIETCRDLEFWRAFLDMMAENRFNALSLWNVHPFANMIRPKNFPEASALSDAELGEWQSFWKKLMSMARERGIAVYILDWNIAVSPAFAKAHGIKERNDTSELTKRYNRECVTQLIDEYPDLAGIGVGLGDWMNGMSSAQREKWIEETAIAGAKGAKRSVRFIHRAPFEGSTAADMRAAIDRADYKDPMLVEIKFNWSHGHSTPSMQVTHSLKADGFVNPPPSNYKIAWTIRNEDFFILRWGQTDFIRQHIAVNGKDYVEGYFIGSEGYIPAKDYSHVDSPHRTWKWAFEKQWLFYSEWGKLLYDPATPDAVFAGEFDRRYGKGIGQDLFAAYNLAGRMPLRLASFHSATWDYTLYSEGFAAYARSNGLFDGKSPLISIDELIDHKTLDPNYVSIPDFIKKNNWPTEAMTPVKLADELEKDGTAALKLIAGVRGKGSPTLECELDDAQTWAELSLYFGEKLRAGVALARFRAGGEAALKDEAIKRLEQCLAHWKEIARLSSAHYKPVPYVSGATFSWDRFIPEAERDVEVARAAKNR